MCQTTKQILLGSNKETSALGSNSTKNTMEDRKKEEEKRPAGFVFESIHWMWPCTGNIGLAGIGN